MGLSDQPLSLLRGLTIGANHTLYQEQEEVNTQEWFEETLSLNRAGYSGVRSPDIHRAFISECLRYGPEFYVRNSDLRVRYQEWLRSRNESGPSNPDLRFLQLEIVREGGGPTHIERITKSPARFIGVGIRESGA